jgi:polysaccharide export outer membrane protein
VNQTSVRLHNGELTLAEAVAGAEGINLSTANTEQIYVIRGVPVESEDGPRIEPRIYQLDASDATALLMADAFPMRPRDVVFVSTAEIVRWNRVMQQIAPTINAAFQIERLESGFTD